MPSQMSATLHKAFRLAGDVEELTDARLFSVPSESEPDIKRLVLVTKFIVRCDCPAATKSGYTQRCSHMTAVAIHVERETGSNPFEGL